MSPLGQELTTPSHPLYTKLASFQHCSKLAEMQSWEIPVIRPLLTLGVIFCLTGCAFNLDCLFNDKNCWDVDQIRPRAQQGDAYAQYQMGFIYREGIDNVSVDFEKSVYWFSKAYESGDVRAAFQIGNTYKNTDIASEDYQIVVYWWRKAGEQGGYRAQRDLAAAYLNGEGVSLDYVEAVYWLEKLAEEHCDFEAYEELGDMYYEGIGVLRDFTESANWYLKAAERGQPSAMMKLADMYAESKGVPQNWYEAYVWFSEAESGECSIGKTEKCLSMNEISSRAEAHLTEEQVERAHVRTKEMRSGRRYPPSCEPFDYEEFDRRVREHEEAFKNRESSTQNH
jgi:hypothetical protein